MSQLWDFFFASIIRVVLNKLDGDYIQLCQEAENKVFYSHFRVWKENSIIIEQILKITIHILNIKISEAFGDFSFCQRIKKIVLFS